MKLIDIHTKFNTDKGIAHNYIKKYDELFEKIRLNEMNILEIGVLFGNSLKMWEHYFENSIIYGIDNFSQGDGNEFHDYKIINGEQISNDLSKHDRIKFYNISCEDEENIKTIFQNIKLDIIIDDAKHTLEQQMNNYRIFNSFLNEQSIYICEDVQSLDNGNKLCQYFLSITPNKNVELINFNIHEREDDRIILIN